MSKVYVFFNFLKFIFIYLLLFLMDKSVSLLQLWTEKVSVPSYLHNHCSCFCIT